MWITNVLREPGKIARGTINSLQLYAKCQWSQEAAAARRSARIIVVLTSSA
jgi:hypothetical protein